MALAEENMVTEEKMATRSKSKDKESDGETTGSQDNITDETGKELRLSQETSSQDEEKEVVPELKDKTFGKEELAREDKELPIVNINKIEDDENKGTNPVIIKVTINGHEVKMELDTGATYTCMSTELYKLIGGGELGPPECLLKTYTGELIRPKGTGKVWVEYKTLKYGTQRLELKVTVVDMKVPTLLGREWLEYLRLDWHSLFPVKYVESVSVKSLEELKRKCPGIFDEKGEAEEGLGEKITLEDIKKKLEGLPEMFPNTFSGRLGRLRDVKAHIPIRENAEHKFHKSRPVPYALRKRVEDELESLEDQGVWKKVRYAKTAAPIVVVLKDKEDPSGPIRICGDYKVTVNGMAPCDNYPLPNTAEQLATLAGGEHFSKIDLKQAYQQVELDESSRELLTVNTHKGLYQPERLQYGVHSATGIFQREIERVLKGIPYVLVRVDDILVTGKNCVEHFVVLMKVLDALEDSGLTVNLKKCEFFKEEVTFCGYRISKSGVRPMKENVNAVVNAPVPRNISEVRSYLGMLNYYQSYLPDLSTVAEPMHRLLRKGTVWKWGEDQRKSFEATKSMLVKAPLLVHFDPSLPIVVHTDASPYGVGAVLSHVVNGEERPVSYSSRALTVAERNYGHIEKEGLALVFAVKKYHHYLFGHQFTMITDHKPLLGLFAETKGIPDRAAARITRWALLLAAYNYKLEYRAGKLNGNADALSRLPLEAEPEDVTSPCVSVNMVELVNSPVTEEDVRKETQKDKTLLKVLKFVSEGWSPECRDEQIRPYWLRRSELSVEGECLLWGGRVIIPSVLRETVLKQLHEVHPGINRMKALARSFVWWPGIDKDIEMVVKSCKVCCMHQNNPASAPSHPWEAPTKPWERIHIDFAGPFMGKMFLIVVDAFSKWIEVEMMTCSTASATVGRMRRIFATHGLPLVLVSDNGSSFVGEEFKQFMLKNGIRHIFTAPYHPSSNGQAERMVRTFKEAMKCLQSGDMDTKLNRLLFTYRMTPSSTTGKSPAELLFQRQPRSMFHRIVPGNNKPKLARKDNEVENKHVKSFSEDDPVWVKVFDEKKKWIAGIVVKKIGKVNYHVVLCGENKVMHRHVDQLSARVPNLGISEEAVQSEPELDQRHTTASQVQVEENRRSNRVTRAPAWTKDYQMKSN